MKKYWNRVVKFLTREDGPTAVEYAVMMALIIVVCIVAITSLGQSTNAAYDKIGKELGKANASVP